MKREKRKKKKKKRRKKFFVFVFCFFLILFIQYFLWSFHLHSRSSALMLYLKKTPLAKKLIKISSFNFFLFFSLALLFQYTVTLFSLFFFFFFNFFYFFLIFFLTFFFVVCSPVFSVFFTTNPLKKHTPQKKK